MIDQTNKQEKTYLGMLTSNLFISLKPRSQSLYVSNIAPGRINNVVYKPCTHSNSREKNFTPVDVASCRGAGKLYF